LHIELYFTMMLIATVRIARIQQINKGLTPWSLVGTVGSEHLSFTQ